MWQHEMKNKHSLLCQKWSNVVIIVYSQSCVLYIDGVTLVAAGSFAKIRIRPEFSAQCSLCLPFVCLSCRCLCVFLCAYICLTHLENSMMVIALSVASLKMELKQRFSRLHVGRCEIWQTGIYAIKQSCERGRKQPPLTSCDGWTEDGMQYVNELTCAHIYMCSFI